MPKTTKQVQALKGELQAWIVANELDHDTSWRDPEDHFAGSTSPLYAGDNRIYTGIGLGPGGSEPVGDSYQVCLVLRPGSEMDSALEGYRKPWDTKEHFDEFEAILDRHGFWFELSSDAIFIYSLD